MFALGNDPLTALDLNSPSIDVPTMPGSVTVTRTATNVTNQAYSYNVSTKAPGRVDDQGDADQGSHPARREPDVPGDDHLQRPRRASTSARSTSSPKTTALHLPVAFFNQQGHVTLSQSCDPTTIQVRATRSAT